MSPDQVIPVSQQGGRLQVQSGFGRSAETPKDRCKTAAPRQGLSRHAAACGTSHRRSHSSSSDEAADQHF